LTIWWSVKIAKLNSANIKPHSASRLAISTGYSWGEPERAPPSVAAG